MMTRYRSGRVPDGHNTCLQRIHVTGGTNGILVDSLRRFQPFTPSFFGRAEDQAYLLSTFGRPDRLGYVHASGLIMRHDKEGFAQEAIARAETGEQETVDNHDLNHAHGMCQPLVALGGKSVDAVVVGGIGGGALKKLTEEGVKTNRTVEGTLSENLSLIKDGKLPEFTLDHTCKGHQHGIGECFH